MAANESRAKKYAEWIVDNQDKKGTPEFETVASAYKLAKQQTVPQLFQLVSGVSDMEQAKERPGFWRSLFDSAAVLGLSDEATAFANNPNEESRRAFLQAAESKYESVGGFGKGENWQHFKEIAGSSLGALVAPAVVATGASAVTSPIGGVAAGFATNTAQQGVQQLLRQAQEQERAIREGRTPQELALGKAAVAAVGSSALDYAQLHILRQLVGKFPIFKNLVSQDKDIAEEAARNLVTAARNGTFKSTGRGILTGVVKNTAFEVPQEVVQTALQRWQAGLPIADEEGKAELFQAALAGAALAPIPGGIAGGLGARSDRETGTQLLDITNRAQTRLEELNAAAAGTPERKVQGPDGKPMKIPGTESRYLTLREKAEKKYLETNLDNPMKLVKWENYTIAQAQRPESKPPEGPKLLPPPRTGGFTVDSEGNAVPRTEAQVDEAVKRRRQEVAEERSMGFGEAENISDRMQGQRVKSFLEQSDDLMKKYEADLDAAWRAKDDMEYLRSLPMEQQQLALEGGFAQPEFDFTGPAEAAPPSMYSPAEQAETLKGLRPGSKPYRAAAKELGLKLNKKGRLKPLQFQPERIEAEVSPGQQRLDFYTEEQLDLPLTLPVSGMQEGVTAQEDMFGRETEQRPIPPSIPLRDRPTEAAPTSTEVLQEIPEGQYALNLPGTPMERLSPRDRILEAMADPSMKKTIANLRERTKLNNAQFGTTVEQMKQEGSIYYEPGKWEWKLTPQGETDVRTRRAAGKLPKSGQRRGSAGVPVSQAGTRSAGTQVPRAGGVAGTVPPTGRTDAGTAAGKPALTTPAPAKTKVATKPSVATSTPAPSAISAAQQEQVRRAKQIARQQQVDERQQFKKVVAELRQAATVANQKGQVGNQAYANIIAELAKDDPDVDNVREALRLSAIRAAGKKAEPAKPAIRLSENATDEEIAAYYKSRQKAAPIKEPKASKAEQATKSEVLDRIVDASESGRISDAEYERLVTEMQKSNPDIEGIKSALKSKKPSKSVQEREDKFSLGSIETNTDYVKKVSDKYKSLTDSQRKAVAEYLDLPQKLVESQEIFNNPEFVDQAITAVIKETELEAKRSEAISIAEANAQGAFDYVSEYESLDDSIGSNRDSVRDTLQELGLDKYEPEAFRAFDERVKEILKSKKPSKPVQEREDKFSLGSVEDGKSAKSESRAILGDGTHPEWAIQFEPETGGVVVYSDADVALITGFSVVGGRTLYIPIKRGVGKAHVDIVNFKGTAFSEAEKERLIEARNSLSDIDSNNFKKYPDGPFTEAKFNVVASSGIKYTSNYTEFLSSLMRSMGLGDVRVFLAYHDDFRISKAEAADLRQGLPVDTYRLYGPYKSALAPVSKSTLGLLRSFGPDNQDFLISVSSDMSERKTIEVITHELGHLIEYVAFNNASPEVRVKIIEEHDAWLKSVRGKHAIELIESLRAYETAMDMSMQLDPKLDYKLNGYWTSFSEWFADNVAKWATTSEKPLGIVQKFFYDLAMQLRLFVSKLTGNKFLPSSAVRDFLDAMGPGSADAWMATASKGSIQSESLEAYSLAPNLPPSTGRGPRDTRSSYKKFFDELDSMSDKLPKPTKETYDSARSAMSRIPPGVRRAAFDLLNLNDLDRMYGKYSKSLRAWWDDVNEEGVKLRKEQDKIGDNLDKWGKVMSRFSEAERDRIFKLFMDTTVEQVEVLELNDPNRRIYLVPDRSNPLYQQFNRLPPDVKQVYKELRMEYIDYSKQMEDVLKQYLTPTEWQKMLNEFNSRKLKVYLPLFRTGDYKLTYQDSNGDTVSRQFETPYLRDRARAEAAKAGGKDFVAEMTNTQNVKGIPPGNFFGEVVGTLRKRGVDETVVREIVNTYLDYLPAKSVLQMSRRRKNVIGYEPDVLEAYANVASSYGRRIANMEYRPKFNKHAEEAKKDFKLAAQNGELDATVEGDLESYVDSYMSFLQNPNLEGWAAKAGYFSYQMYLGANISTAGVNTLDLPTITLSRLAGKYGYGKASGALTEAGAKFFQKGKLDKIRESDLTPAQKELKELYKSGLDSGVLREQQLRDVAEFKNINSKWEKRKAMVERASNWAFAKSDMFNRETALIAGYKLAKEKLNSKRPLNAKIAEGTFDKEAFADAKRGVYDVFTSSFPKAAPPIMGNDLARVALTFKRFAITRMWLLYNAYREATEGQSQEVKDAARKELLGYFGTAFLFAGVKGMPLVGAATALASLLFSWDEDEPIDPDFAIRDAVGLLAYKGPVNYALGVDIASRTGWSGLFWREDPKRMAEVGPATYVVEQLLGPAFSYAANVLKKDGAIDLMKDGQYGRAMEQLLPRAIGNPLKAYRYAEEGAITANGRPLVNDVNAWNLFMQVFGFRPTDVVEAGEEAGAVKRMEQSIKDRRDAIISKAVIARIAGDEDGFQEARKDAKRFSEKYPERRITDLVLNDAVKRRRKGIEDSVNGVIVDPKLAPRIYKELGIDPEDGQEE